MPCSESRVTGRIESLAEISHPLTFTPAEWRSLVEDQSFLDDPDNRYAAPRRLMGVPVRIVPDHMLFV